MVRYVVELPAHQRSQALGGPLGLVMKCPILSPSRKQRAPREAERHHCLGSGEALS